MRRISTMLSSAQDDFQRNNPVTDIFEKIAAQRIIPVLVVGDIASARPLAAALVEGGLPIVEVTMRTPRALDIAREIAAVDGAIVGIGTVLNSDHCKAAIDAGAAFIVSPGFDQGVIKTAAERGVPAIPGISTISELQRAWNAGVRIVKFFPAGIAGGPPAIRAFANVIAGVRFMPTGGVNMKNLADYLAIDAVIACGGSWIAPPELIEARKFAEIRNLAADASTAAKR